MDFAGAEVELRGYFRTKDVTGSAGLWMREDGEGQMLKLENMVSQHVDGTREWSEYTIKLPIDANARQLVFGVLLAGNGTLWADDLRLLVDDKPIAQAKPMERVLTVIRYRSPIRQGIAGCAFISHAKPDRQPLHTWPRLGIL